MPTVGFYGGMLRWASKIGHLEVVERLLAAGADVHAAAFLQDGITPA